MKTYDIGGGGFEQTKKIHESTYFSLSGEAMDGWEGVRGWVGVR